MPSWDQSQGRLTLEHSLSTHSNDRNLTFGKTLPLQRRYFSLVCITHSLIQKMFVKVLLFYLLGTEIEKWKVT